ncbi:hypothetical protein KAI87_02430, partial [Myxococcota bacterium]|nr:hypothetical protein [Myxococcota bacterium]
MKIKALILSLFALSLIACDEDVPIKEGLVPTTGRFFVLDDAGTDGRTGWWPSMTLDKNEDPHLTYCDVYNGDLKYATRKNGHWHVDVVESKGAVGKYTALALDANDSPAIVFYDQDQKYLRYAWKDEENKWKTERIAWGLEVGMASELRFGHDGLPHLFYYVASGKMIHAVRTKAGVWDKKKIYDAGGGFSVEISPVLRKDGFWLTFVAWTLKDTTLFLARPDGEGGFKTEVVS